MVGYIWYLEQVLVKTLQSAPRADLFITLSLILFRFIFADRLLLKLQQSQDPGTQESVRSIVFAQSIRNDSDDEFDNEPKFASESSPNVEDSTEESPSRDVESSSVGPGTDLPAASSSSSSSSGEIREVPRVKSEVA